MAESRRSPESDRASEGPQRRSFIASFLAIIVGSFIGLFSVISGLIVYLDPLRPRRGLPQVAGGASEGEEGFVKVCSAQAVDTQPRRFPIVTDKMDAWNYLPNQPVGSVYLSKDKDGSLLVLHTTCPHAGCSVALSPDGDAFHCPCHNSSFNLEGERKNRPGKENPSPRDMDQLEYDEALYRENGEIWVKYVDYYTGRETQVPKI